MKRLKKAGPAWRNVTQARLILMNNHEPTLFMDTIDGAGLVVKRQGTACEICTMRTTNAGRRNGNALAALYQKNKYASSITSAKSSDAGLKERTLL